MDLPITIETSDGPSVQNASAELLAQLLPMFESELARAGVPVDECFAPGLDRATTATAFQELGLPLSDELATWFAWHDGVTDLSKWSHAFPHWEFYPLDTIIAR